MSAELEEWLDAWLAKPDAERPEALGEEFNPWDLFPAVYGSYSSEFDEAALHVLRCLNQPKFTWAAETLAHEMLLEMLCVSGFCDYGTSPRGAWAEPFFKARLTEIIARWETYVRMKWGEDDGKA